MESEFPLLPWQESAINLVWVSYSTRTGVFIPKSKWIINPTNFWIVFRILFVVNVDTWNLKNQTFLQSVAKRIARYLYMKLIVA